MFGLLYKLSCKTLEFCQNAKVTLQPNAQIIGVQGRQAKNYLPPKSGRIYAVELCLDIRHCRNRLGIARVKYRCITCLLDRL